MTPPFSDVLSLLPSLDQEPFVPKKKRICRSAYTAQPHHNEMIAVAQRSSLSFPLRSES
jgi:hypothetical protein